MRRFFLLSSFLILSLYISAQLFNKIEYAPATIVFADGHSKNYAQVKMPVAIYPIVAYSSEDRSAESRESFQMKDISQIRFWNEGTKTETIIHRLQMKPYFTLGREHWGILEAQNDWGALYRCYSSFGLDKKGDVVGEISAESFPSAGGPLLDSPIMIALLHSGEEEGEWVAYLQAGKKTKLMWFDISGKRMINYIEESHPDLAEQIRKKQLKANDLLYIFDQLGK